jgi:tetratricopeptide (TPR) repeat protein
MLAMSAQALGWDKLTLGDLEEAEEYQWIAYHAWRRLKNRWVLLENLRCLAMIEQYRGLYEQGVELLEQAFQLGKRTGRPQALVDINEAKASLEFDRGDLLRARDHLDELIPFIENNQRLKIIYLFLSGRLGHVQGKNQDACNFLEKACELLKTSSRSYRWPEVFCLLAVVFHELGEDRLAWENFHRALKCYIEFFAHPELIETLEWLAVFCADLEEWGVAAHFLAAIDSLRKISGIVPPVPYRELWAQTRERVKENLSKSKFQEACDEASVIEQLSLPKYALEQLARLNTDG